MAEFCKHKHRLIYHIYNTANDELVAVLKLCNSCAFPLLYTQLGGGLKKDD